MRGFFEANFFSLVPGFKTASKTRHLPRQATSPYHCSLNAGNEMKAIYRVDGRDFESMDHALK
jgi:hypothetical protein